MKRKIAASLAAVALVVSGASVNACSQSHDRPTPPRISIATLKLTTARTASPNPSTPKPPPASEPDEAKDVSGLRLVASSGYWEEAKVVCNITNHSSKTSNYQIDVYSVDPDGETETTNIVAAYVMPGKTVPCPVKGTFTTSFTLEGATVSAIRVDRLPVGTVNSPDEQLALESITLANQGTRVAYAVTNNADYSCSYTVSYSVRAWGEAEVYRSSFKTKSLGPLDTVNGSLVLPKTVTEKLRDSLGNNMTIDDLKDVTVLDVDRNPRR
ncbi:hypothetical protein [Streptomyces sp. NPDC023588]|uniref:hypothetical protein n=1 Tax=Streptomyces sp. NPDC023588 TaxID=3154907 RepID=UPI0033FC60C5